ncbi:MAG: AAA family ATPase, partial [bacterium]|nr:AAA family ATPase [bacterium]
MILLKRLELQGFKSFANKTVFDFPSRITAIVGPNGSGKSNVMDALRWILGERDAKHLRGEKLENLIFAGTPKRGAAGLAKVTLYFNNQDNYFSTGDLAEVVLSRKIDRSGVSKFFLNNEEILLRDVAGFLAKAKLGSRGLAMISQGESDIFVKSTATERRLMIEEILGLREYRLKKNSAEKSLAASEINLEKVRAMLEELAPHLRLLRRQKNRWEKRKEIEDELLGLENSFFFFQFKNLKDRLADNEKSLIEAEKEEAIKKGIVAELDTELKAFHQNDNRRERLGQLRTASRELVIKKNGLERELIKLEVRVETEVPTKSNNRIDWPATEAFLRDLRKDFDRILVVEDLSLWRQKMSQWLDEIKKILFEEENPKINPVSQPEDFSEKLEELKNLIADLEKELNQLTEEEEKLLLFEEKDNQGWRVLLDRLEEAKRESDKARDFQQRLILEKEKLNWQFGDLKNRFEALGRSITELEDIKPENNTEDNDWDSVERRILRSRGELAAIGEIDEGLVKEAEETESRFQTLSAELADLEKASVDLHRLIKDLDLKISDDFKKSFRLI